MPVINGYFTRDMSGTGNTYITEGTVTDATYTSSSFFGFLVKQSTASFFQKHYFDDIEIKHYGADITPPSIQSAFGNFLHSAGCAI